MYPAQEILLQSGQITQFGTGIYAYNNVPLLLRRNVEKIITETLNKYGCIEILLPTLQLTLTSSKNLLNSALICRNL